jgi:Zn-dependent protease with chaperone function
MGSTTQPYRNMLPAMWRGRRSDWMLAGLGLVAIGNGIFLGLFLYGLLAAVLKLLGEQRPPLGYAWLAGGLAGAALLFLSLQREKVLRESTFGPVPADPGAGEEEGGQADPLAMRFNRLFENSELAYEPTLWWIESVEPNAFAAGSGRDDASIVLTTGLLELLGPEELDAVLAHEIAHVESEDLKAVGRADAVADSIDDLAQAKGRFFWGPRAIVADMQPFIVVSIAGLVLLLAMENSTGNAGLTLLVLLLALAWLSALWNAAKRSWRGLVQLFLFTGFLGPLSLVEWLLAPPTAFFLSRLVSRARIHEADARSVELAGGRVGLLSALRKLEFVERAAPREELAGRRFSLFVCSRPQSGYRAWLAHLYATHPSIASRIETIEGLDQPATSVSSSRS